MRISTLENIKKFTPTEEIAWFFLFIWHIEALFPDDVAYVFWFSGFVWKALYIPTVKKFCCFFYLCDVVIEKLFHRMPIRRCDAERNNHLKRNELRCLFPLEGWLCCNIKEVDVEYRTRFKIWIQTESEKNRFQTGSSQDNNDHVSLYKFHQNMPNWRYFGKSFRKTAKTFNHFALKVCLYLLLIFMSPSYISNYTKLVFRLMMPFMLYPLTDLS